MARKRAYKKRVDYRKGGRVKYKEGSEVFDPNTGEPVFNPEIYEDSFILFHPFQFKSIYNTGEFNPAVKNFLGKYSKRKNKYQKVA